MCTAITYKTDDFYFGRTLDYDTSFGEKVCITPRNFELHFRHMPPERKHYAIIGMACVAEGYPLYYDAANEKGLCVAGLNFVGNAHYGEVIPEKDNIAQFEFIPWVLCRCDSVKSARKLLEKINITNTPFNKALPVAELHWLIADKREAIVVESTENGLFIHDNPVGVLTNNPPFCEQLFALNNYMALSPQDPQNRFGGGLELKTYSRGMGAIGLPGDLSSQSRFIRASFVRCNSVSEEDELASVGQFFHILSSVEQQRGCCVTENGKWEITLYSSCINAQKGIYYYTTYTNRQITAVDMFKENLEGKSLVLYELKTREQINFKN